MRDYTTQRTSRKELTFEATLFVGGHLGPYTHDGVGGAEIDGAACLDSLEVQLYALG